MGGFSNVGTDDVVYADNVDFSGDEPQTKGVTADGQLLIGSAVAPNIRVATLTPGTGISIVNSAGGISISADNNGNVVGTPPSTDMAIARYDGTSGLLIENSLVTISDNGAVTSTGDNDGGAVTSIFTNNNNTAGSYVQFQVRSGGASAGDAYYSWKVLGVTDWAMGIDNSDDDALVISKALTLGGANRWKMTTDGERTLPLQPAFLAFLGTTDSAVTGDSTVFTLGSGNALTEVFDQGGDFVTTGTFTAPVTGRFFLNFNINVANGSGNSTTTQWIEIVTSNRSYLQSWPTRDQVTGFFGVNARNTFCLNQLVDMDAGDTATFTFTCAGAASKVSSVIGAANGNTSVSGYLVC
jgi:hypothetical protein